MARPRPVSPSMLGPQPSSTWVCAEMLVYHRRFDDRRGLYPPPSIQGLHRLRRAGRAHGGGIRRSAGATRRGDVEVARLARRAPHRTRRSSRPCRSSPVRAVTATTSRSPTAREISLTHYWDWTGFPVAALPAGVGRRSGLPVGVSLIGAPGPTGTSSLREASCKPAWASSLPEESAEAVQRGKQPVDLVRRVRVDDADPDRAVRQPEMLQDLDRVVVAVPHREPGRRRAGSPPPAAIASAGSPRTSGRDPSIVGGPCSVQPSGQPVEESLLRARARAR